MLKWWFGLKQLNKQNHEIRQSQLTWLNPVL